MFWVDLTSANMMTDGAFATATYNTKPGTFSGATLDQYFPRAKSSSYVYVWSGGAGLAFGSNDNYFGIAGIGQILAGWEVLNATGGRPVAMTVRDAYTIDQKIDDGSPFTDSVKTIMVYGAETFSANTTGNGGPTKCSDNPSEAPGGQQYAMDVNGGIALTCALSFKFQ